MKPMLQMLHSKIIPWTKSEDRRLVLSRPQIKTEDLPRGVMLSQRRATGQRIITKKRRDYANQRLYVANWPDDNLQEIALPRIACVVNGTADYLLENYCLHCNEGTFILIPARTPHQRRGPFLDALRPPDATCTLLFAQAYSHGVDLWFSSSTGTRHTHNMVDHFLIRDAVAAQLFEAMMNDAIAGNKHYETICNDLLHAFFIMLAREIEAGHFAHPGPRENRASSASSPQSFICGLTEFIESNFTRRVRLAEAAAHMYLSSPQFCRRVRQETGVTFTEMLTRYRLKRAQELLRETDWTASVISQYVGFESSTYFQNLFRRRIGCTPIEYRHKNDNFL